MEVRRPLGSWTSSGPDAPANILHRQFLSNDQWAQVSTYLHLSPRESQISQLVLLNLSEADIARSLSVSVHTVHSHSARLYRKLHIASRSELVVALFKAHVSLPSTTTSDPVLHAPRPPQVSRIKTGAHR